MKADGFFHDMGEGLYYDNALDWDLWQREQWKDMVLSKKAGEVILTEDAQTVRKVDGEQEEILSENAVITLYPEKFEVTFDGKTITMEMDKIKQISLAGKDTIFAVDDKIFLDIRSDIPRSSTKYIAAWRYLTGKAYY